MVALGFYGSKIELFISASEVADTWTEFIITDQKYFIQLESTKYKNQNCRKQKILLKLRKILLCKI